jgi:O-methyltransferase
MSGEESLNELAVVAGTDKSSKYHNYTAVYEKYFKHMRYRFIKILEIGVGQGGSLRTWLKYFPNAHVYGMDIDPHCWQPEGELKEKCTVVIGDQANPDDLRRVAELGPFDIIIDDGGHTMSQQQIACEYLFDYVKQSGLYIIEDLHTCFMSHPQYEAKTQRSTYAFLDDRVRDLQLHGKNKGEQFCANRVKHVAMLDNVVLNKWERSLEFVHHYRSIVFLGKAEDGVVKGIKVQKPKSEKDLSPEIRHMYLDCLAKSIINYYYVPTGVYPGPTYGQKLTEYDLQHGNQWPDQGVSMIGLRALKTLGTLLDIVEKDDIEGDIVEAGVWKGGASMFMRGVLNSYDDQTRKIYVCDSFEGLPPPDEKYEADKGDILHTYKYLAVDIDSVKGNFDRFGLTHANNVFVKGWFKDTLPGLPVEKISLLRLDGDLYSSTIETLDALYDKVSVGGYIFVDDYGLHMCKKAVDDFRRSRGITSPIVQVTDTQKVYWRKSA